MSDSKMSPDEIYKQLELIVGCYLNNPVRGYYIIKIFLYRRTTLVEVLLSTLYAISLFIHV